MVFRAPFALNIEHGRNFKWWCPPVDGGSKGAPPPRCSHNLEIFAVKPNIVGVAGANMQWGRFVCHSCSQTRESTAFELVLRSCWGLLSPSKQVGRSSTPCRKRSQVWGRESER